MRPTTNNTSTPSVEVPVNQRLCVFRTDGNTDINLRPGDKTIYLCVEACGNIFPGTPIISDQSWHN